MKPAASKNTIKPSRSGYAEVNGLKMYYEIYGEGKPLVLLHGSFMSGLGWSEFLPGLSENRMVIVTEMQAHGRTRDIDRALSYQAMADDVSGLLDHLKIGKADLLGYSMGAGVAFQMGVRHPEQVRRLIILSGVYAHDGWWPDAEASFPSLNGDLLRGSPIETDYLKLGNKAEDFDGFVKKVISIDLEKYNWTKEVSAIKAPVFYIIGDADGVRYEHALDLFRARGGGKMGDMHGLPESRLAVLPATTHVGMLEKSEMLVPMIVDYLDSELGSKPPGG